MRFFAEFGSTISLLLVLIQITDFGASYQSPTRRLITPNHVRSLKVSTYGRRDEIYKAVSDYNYQDVDSKDKKDDGYKKEGGADRDNGGKEDKKKGEGRLQEGRR